MGNGKTKTNATYLISLTCGCFVVTEAKTAPMSEEAEQFVKEFLLVVNEGKRVTCEECGAKDVALKDIVLLNKEDAEKWT